MIYRIDLSKTNYTELDYRMLGINDYPRIKEIYQQYCDYKKFEGTIPIFIEDIVNPYSETIGYYHNNELVAFSLIFIYRSKHCANCEQFAWDYETPKLKLGIKSLKSECARYKRLGYRYLYLGEYDEYKAKFAGFELAKSH